MVPPLHTPPRSEIRNRACDHARWAAGLAEGSVCVQGAKAVWQLGIRHALDASGRHRRSAVGEVSVQEPGVLRLAFDLLRIGAPAIVRGPVVDEGGFEVEF